MAEALSYLLVIFREPMLLVMTAIGTCAGVYVGAIPGLSGTMAVSLLVSFTFGWETHMALAIMIGVFVGAVFGGLAIRNSVEYSGRSRSSCNGAGRISAGEEGTCR